MEKDFIELPWFSDGFICDFCKKEHFYLFQYCSKCGKKNDLTEILESKLKESHPCISDIEQLKVIFEELRGLKIRFWDYSISHATTQLRIAHCDANAQENRFNTVIVSANTKLISSSTSSWNLDLKIESYKGEYGTIYKLIDKKAGFLLEASFVGLYQQMPARFFGI